MFSKFYLYFFLLGQSCYVYRIKFIYLNCPRKKLFENKVKDKSNRERFRCFPTINIVFQLPDILRERHTTCERRRVHPSADADDGKNTAQPSKVFVGLKTETQCVPFSEKTESNSLIYLDLRAPLTYLCR